MLMVVGAFFIGIVIGGIAVGITLLILDKLEEEE